MFVGQVSSVTTSEKRLVGPATNISPTRLIGRPAAYETGAANEHAAASAARARAVRRGMAAVPSRAGGWRRQGNARRARADTAGARAGARRVRSGRCDRAEETVLLAGGTGKEVQRRRGTRR